MKQLFLPVVFSFANNAPAKENHHLRSDNSAIVLS